LRIKKFGGYIKIVVDDAMPRQVFTCVPQRVRGVQPSLPRAKNPRAIVIDVSVHEYKIEIEVSNVEEDIGDGNCMILTGWAAEGDEITGGAKFSVPLWNVGGKGAHLKLTFADGDTIYYSPLYHDWQNSVGKPNIPIADFSIDTEQLRFFCEPDNAVLTFTKEIYGNYLQNLPAKTIKSITKKANSLTRLNTRMMMKSHWTIK
jgi:hypothetical protein